MSKETTQPIDRDPLYKQMVENVMTAIFIIQDDRYIYINPRFTDLLGYSLDDLEGRRFYELVAARDRAWIREREEKRMAGESLPAYYTYWAKHKEGREVCLEVMVRLIHLHGRPAILGNMVDVSELRSSEQRERALQKQLIHAEKYASLGQLATGVVLELNNPLTGIYAGAQVLLYRLPPSLEDERTKLQDIIESAERIQYLIRNFLSLSDDALSDYRTMCDINDIVREARQYYEFELYRAEIKMEEHLAQGLAQVYGSPGELKQVLVNLMINAREAIKSPGGKIRLSTSREGDEIKIIVSDTGEGIPMGNLEKIFEPFFTTRGGGRATGLGLSIAQGIITAHGGTIGIQSEQGRGSEVTIRLPVSKG